MRDASNCHFQADSNNPPTCTRSKQWQADPPCFLPLGCDFLAVINSTRNAPHSLNGSHAYHRNDSLSGAPRPANTTCLVLCPEDMHDAFDNFSTPAGPDSHRHPVNATGAALGRYLELAVN